MRSGIVKDGRYMEHFMGAFHPESPRRLEAIYKMLEEERGLSALEIKARPATEEELTLIHSPSYVHLIKETAGKDRVWLDPDTATSPRSYEVALLAAGGLLEAADSIMQGKIESAFALVRPPGHHAESSQARGFCIFNNLAIAAANLIKNYGFKRVLIVDWDLHHGNGTQNSFYSRKDVLYFSTHQFPHYPGTGHWSEIGWAEGEGYTVNVPLSPGKGDSDYIHIFRKVLIPLARQYRPEFILVSAGFDNCAGDPLGGMEVSADGFGAMASELRNLAAVLCQGRLLLTLEGGYHLVGLQEGVKRVLYELAGKGKDYDVQSTLSGSMEKDLAPVLKVLQKYWKIG